MSLALSLIMCILAAPSDLTRCKFENLSVINACLIAHDTDKIPLIEIESVHFLYSDESVIEIETILDGYNSGRIYHLRPPPSSLHGWIEQIRDQVEKARVHKTSYFRRFRK